MFNKQLVTLVTVALSVLSVSEGVFGRPIYSSPKLAAREPAAADDADCVRLWLACF